MPDPRFPFSNFQPAKVYMDGYAYPTVEHAYQAAKSNLETYRFRVRTAPTPGAAKRLGQRVKLKPTWERDKRRIMLDLLRQKFRPGTLAAEQLIAFSGEIIEWNEWHDNYWGICTCTRCGSVGQNYLGRLLMQLRTELRDNTD